MQQEIPNAINPLKGKGVKLVRGLELLEKAVGVKLNTKSVVSGDVDALQTAQQEAQTAKAESKAVTARLNKTNTEVGYFIRLARDVVKPQLGSRYSIAWHELGFVNNSLGVARTMNARLGHLKMLSLYFSRHPEMEAPGKVTAALAAELHEKYLTDITTSNIAMTTKRQKTLVRDAAVVAMRSRIRKLFQELKQLMPRDDARWLEFGFNIPAAVSVPAAPEGVAVNPALAGEAALRWNKTANTDRFHVWQQTVGIDSEPMRVATVTDTAKKLTDLTPGAHMQFYVTALNAAGESVASQVVEFFVT